SPQLILMLLAGKSVACACGFASVNWPSLMRPVLTPATYASCDTPVGLVSAASPTVCVLDASATILPVLSRTVSVIVCWPSSAYVWPPSMLYLPLVDQLTVLCDPSPQPMVAVYGGLLVPLDVKTPTVPLHAAPSTTPVRALTVSEGDDTETGTGTLQLG